MDYTPTLQTDYHRQSVLKAGKEPKEFEEEINNIKDGNLLLLIQNYLCEQKLTKPIRNLQTDVINGIYRGNILTFYQNT